MSNVLRYLGFAEETTYNQALSPDAMMHLDIASSSLDAPADTELIYPGGLGKVARTRKAGFYTPSGDIVVAVDIRSIGYFLKYALHGYVFTAGDPNLHELYGDNEQLLDSFVARLGKVQFEHVFSGCCINSLRIAVEGEFCMLTIGVNSAKDAKATIKAISELLLPTSYPLAFHEVTASVGDKDGDYADESAIIKTFTLDIANNIDAVAGRSIGSRFPRRMPAKERVLTISGNLWYEDLEKLERVWGGSTGPVAGGSVAVKMRFTFNAGSDGSMIMELPNAYYSQVGQTITGRDEIVQAFTARALLEEDVTLADDVTKVDTEMLVSLSNDEDEMEPAGS